MMTQVRKKRPPATPRHAAARRGPLDKLLAPALFKALSDPTRLSLISCIAKCGRGCSVGEVAECCEVDLSVVSRHLALLARSGVLSATKQGRTTFYSVRYAELCASLRALAAALDECCPDDCCAKDQKNGGSCDGNCC